MRLPIFNIDTHYRVKKSFMSWQSTFIAGEVLDFVRDYYSRYDSSFVFQFKSRSDGQEKFWHLHEDDPKDTWKQYFEPIEFKHLN